MAIRKKIRKTSKTKSMGKIAHIKTTIDGIKFDSKMEAQYYEYLKAQKELGEVLEFRLQPEYVLQNRFIVVEGKVITDEDPDFDKIKRKHKAPITRAIKYIADFEVVYKDGTTAIIDTKGLKTTDFKMKEKMFAFRYPTLNLLCLVYDKKLDKWVDFDEYQKSKKRSKKQKDEEKKL